MTRFSTRLLVAAALVAATAVVFGSAASAGGSQQIPIGGTGTAVTGSFTPSGSGDVTQAEFAGEPDSDAGPDAYPGTIADKSLSQGFGTGPAAPGTKKAKSNPALGTSFEGLNLYQQRYA